MCVCSQLRFYWEKDDDDCFVKQCTGRFSYGVWRPWTASMRARG
jgi:hypothetical protein